jgi:ATP-dependent Clp protease ATP-binding subunit ClpA
MVQQRVLETAKGRFLFRVTQPARDFLLREGTDMKYGARHLKRAIERHVVYPLASLLATEQVSLGDVISIDWDGRWYRWLLRRPTASAKRQRQVRMAERRYFRRRLRRLSPPRRRE